MFASRIQININSSHELFVYRQLARYYRLLIHNQKLHNKISAGMIQKMYRIGSE